MAREQSKRHASSEIDEACIMHDLRVAESGAAHVRDSDHR